MSLDLSMKKYSVNTIVINEAIVFNDEVLLKGDTVRLPRIVVDRLRAFQQQARIKHGWPKDWLFSPKENDLKDVCRSTPQMVSMWINEQVPFQMLSFKKATPVHIQHETKRRIGENPRTVCTPENDPIAFILSVSD